MDENNENKSELKKGLFGATDREKGEYHFKSGDVEKIYTNAHYIPYGEDATPQKYYQPVVNKTKKRKRSVSFVVVVMLCLFCAVLGGSLGAGLMTVYFDQRVNEVENSVKSMSVGNEVTDQVDGSSPISSTASDTEAGKELSSEEIYELACNQVVSIITEYVSYNMPGQVTGSGIVGSDDGLILTNFHVIEKAYLGGYGVTVSFKDGTTYDGKVIAVDASNDLAIVKIDAQGLNAATFCTDPVIGGTEITIAGNPYGLFNVSSGKISNPSIDVDADDNGNVINMFQLDVSVYEGNSGGPVYNKMGQVIGIVTAKVSVDSSDGIGFAIPIEKASNLYNQVISNGYITPASLGVEFFEDYDDMFMSYYSYPQGAFVEDVKSGSCAEKVGIEVGDVILELDGNQITSYTDAQNIIKSHRSGDTINVVLFRNAQVYSAQVTLD